MKKRIMTIALALCLLAVAAMGTIAYFTDTKEATNVMTVGTVSIEMAELERKEGVSHIGTASGNLQEFTQNQKIYPAAVKGAGAWTAMQTSDKAFYWNEYVYTGTSWNGLWDDSLLGNVVDKFVFVKNTGTEDIYFRTIVAVECPEGMEVGDGSVDEIGLNVNSQYADEWLGAATIGGVNYDLRVFTYADGRSLAAGNQAHPSLLQVALSDKLNNDDMAKFGTDGFQIKVLTQACQKAGFDTLEQALDEAFGDLTAAGAAALFATP